MTTAVVHVAGPPSLDGGQSCSRCGESLIRTLRSPRGLLSPFIEGDEIAVLTWRGGTYTYRVGVLEPAGRYTHRTFGEVVEEPCA